MKQIKPYQIRPEESLCADCPFTGDSTGDVVAHVLVDHPEVIDLIERRERLMQQRKLTYLRQNPPSTPIGNIFGSRLGWKLIICYFIQGIESGKTKENLKHWKIGPIGQ
jgi:hypothetical protein